MNNIWKFLSDTDNIKTLISTLAFILSLINTAYLIYTQRFKLNASFKEYTIVDSICDKPLILGTIIENYSRVPTSVSRMYLYINNKKYEFSWFPQIVFSSSFNDKSENKSSTADVWSLCFPQNISSLGSCCGYFVVRTEGKFNVDDLKKSNCRIEIHTNRGKRKFKIDFSTLDCKLSR